MLPRIRLSWIPSRGSAIRKLDVHAVLLECAERPTCQAQPVESVRSLMFERLLPMKVASAIGILRDRSLSPAFSSRPRAEVSHSWEPKYVLVWNQRHS